MQEINMSYHNDLFITKRRLTEWGNWCCQIVTMGLGYSHQSLIAKLQAEGGAIIAGTAKALVPSNERAEEVNDLVERLAVARPNGEGKPKWAKVIRIHYTMRRPNKTKILASQLNERTYYRYLRDAQNWLAPYLAH